MWKSTHSVCGTRPDKEADGKVQVDGDCTKFTHPSYYDLAVDGDDTHFLDALASLKTMLDIQWLMFSRLQDYRVIESITECYKVLQSIT